MEEEQKVADFITKLYCHVKLSTSRPHVRCPIYKETELFEEGKSLKFWTARRKRVDAVIFMKDGKSHIRVRGVDLRVLLEGTPQYI